jgi:hypothetical protein
MMRIIIWLDESFVATVSYPTGEDQKALNGEG